MGGWPAMAPLGVGRLWSPLISASAVVLGGAGLLNWCIRPPGPGTYCPSLIRPPTNIAAPARHHGFVGHFSLEIGRFCMGNQKDRLTATKPLNHLVRLFSTGRRIMPLDEGSTVSQVPGAGGARGGRYGRFPRAPG
jgi:hypothetical protein